MPGFFGDFRIGLGFGTRSTNLLSGFGGIPIIVPILPPRVIDDKPVSDVNHIITSMSSSTVFHSTLFEDLGLKAESTYRFYTTDEKSTFTTDASASLESLPRYVSLTWNPASAPRDFTLSRKGLRPFDPRTPAVLPALDVSAARNAAANGYIAPGSIQALLVQPVSRENVPIFDEDFFLSSPSARGGSAAALAGTDSEFHTVSNPVPTSRIRVNFIDPSIAGALDSNRIRLATDHTHLASLGSFAKLVSGLEVVSEFNQDVSMRNPVPRFPAAINTPDVMYIGYVIERYTLDASGAMELSRTIVIGDPGQSSFIDREVVFGGRYSYRIRTFVQWTHGPSVGFFGSSSLDRNSAFDDSQGSLARQASFYSAEWSDWARTAVLDTVPPDPPDELLVMTLSTKRQVRITWKMPNDPQRDIASISLLRSIGQGGGYSAWEWLATMIPSNGVYVDTDVEVHEKSNLSYMYAMYSTSFHGQKSVLSEKIAVRLTERSAYLGEEPVKLVGPQGDDPMGHAVGMVAAIPTEIIALDRVVAYARGGESALPLFDRPYVIEIQSLSTGERAEVILNVDTTDVELTPIGTTRST